MSSAGLQRLLGQPGPIAAHCSAPGGCQRIIPCLTSLLTPPSRSPLYNCVAPGTRGLQS